MEAVAMNFGDQRLPARFWDKVQPCPMSGCWLWFGSTLRDGYGQVGRDRKVVRAHRWTYEVAMGSIPDGLAIDHRCRVRCCVNPAHLEAVSPGDNIRRGDTGENNRAKTTCPEGHAYDATDHKGARYCLECRRNHHTHNARLRRARKSRRRAWKR